MAFLLVFAPCASAQAAPPPPSEQSTQGGSLRRLSIEELARINVISSSRQGEIVTEAAAAISVITGDALRRAGITTIPDAMRLAIGVSVGRDGNTWAISARGFQASATNKMVVLVDGRSVYSPLFSGVFWDAVDLVIDDIDRIEVVRGAGGTLWGANAVNGVINIITKLASETQGAFLQVAGGSNLGIVAARYGGTAGGNGHFRIYAKHRDLQSMPYTTGVDPDEDLRTTQAGFRLDLGVNTRSSFMLRADAYDGAFGLVNSDDGAISGADVVGRFGRTLESGAQLQLNAYYDTTYRRIPTQYTERRHTGNVEFQYAQSAGKRHHVIAGLGAMVTHDQVTPTPVWTFDPPARTTALLNVFAQDDITLVPGRFGIIVGSKFEHNSFTGFEYQPTFRVRWTPSAKQMVWGGISRAVRMPTRIDSDLRFTPGTPFVVLSGNPDFQSEVVIAREVGYRLRTIPHVALGITAFVNSYDKLRSQEPTPPTGFPIVLGNKENGRVAGLEIGGQFDPSSRWQIQGSYSALGEDFSFDADSLDPTNGRLEHNDPPHQFRLRSFSDLPGRFALDATVRWVAALPDPAVPAYGELTLRVARPFGKHLELEVIGDNLLHDRHLEFVQLGPPHAVPRSVFARLTWRQR